MQFPMESLFSTIYPLSTRERERYLGPFKLGLIMRKTTLCALCFANVHGLANRLVTLNPEAGSLY